MIHINVNILHICMNINTQIFQKNAQLFSKIPPQDIIFLKQVQALMFITMPIPFLSDA